MPDYNLIGQRVRVHLYDREGRLLGAVEGRVADVAEKVNVALRDGEEILKDLAYVVDIAPLKGPVGPDGTREEVPYTSSAGAEGEGWFAIQDLQPLDDDAGLPPHLSAN
ncbi:MAG: hypothetical protein R3362_12115, partial [Rhodothermales bacterium]|nr:hypothetical protein [Rhodothermales bacterium]